MLFRSKWLFPGDIHFDQQDDEALHLMTSIAVSEGVSGICLIGDTHNSLGISRHLSLRAARHYRNGEGTIRAERLAAEPHFNRWKTHFSKFLALEGNHEKWWLGVQNDYPGLLDTNWYELYGDLYNGVHVYNENTALKFGPLLAMHGHRARGSLAKKSAATVLQNYPGQNTIYGHTHRIESCTTPTYKDCRPTEHGAWTIGHMRDREKELDDPDIGPYAERHQQGFAIVTFFDRGDGRSEEHTV